MLNSSRFTFKYGGIFMDHSGPRRAADWLAVPSATQPAGVANGGGAAEVDEHGQDGVLNRGHAKSMANGWSNHTSTIKYLIIHGNHGVSWRYQSCGVIITADSTILENMLVWGQLHGLAENCGSFACEPTVSTKAPVHGQKTCHTWKVMTSTFGRF